jgi:ribosomal protein S12 methylthiotransferase
MELSPDNSSPPQPLRVALVSLGCAKNLVDAEIMLGCLAQHGMEITAETALADVVVVNTCSFIDAAKEESIDTILEHAAVREAQHRGQALVVAGCLPQRFQNELPALMPEIDAFMGLDQVTQAPEIVRQAYDHRSQRVEHARQSRGSRRRIRGPLAKSPDPAPLLVTNPRSTFIPDFTTPRFKLTPAHFAYVKVAEGCNHPCSFCIIPRIRGSHRSRTQPDVVAECRHLLAEGVRELNLISQDTTYFGLDRRRQRSGPAASPIQFQQARQQMPADASTLDGLLRELNALPGKFWIRILYTHPAHWTDALIDTIAECSHVARYIDIPLQHIHPVMLERMRRETTSDYLEDLLVRLRQRIPGLALRTTFIVGFPGETDEHFETLLSFMKRIRFERLGVFTYSPEDGTRAARMGGQIPEKIRQQRRDRAMQSQREIARRIGASCVGKTLQVLVETSMKQPGQLGAEVRSWEHGLVRNTDQHHLMGPGQWWVARSHADAPDIDGRVYIRGGRDLAPGEFADVRVIGHTDYDLIAECVGVNP